MTGVGETGSLRYLCLSGVRGYAAARAAGPSSEESEWKSGISDAVDLSDGSRRAVLVSASRAVVPFRGPGRTVRVAESGAAEEGSALLRGRPADIPSILASYRRASAPPEAAPLVDMFI